MPDDAYTGPVHTKLFSAGIQRLCQAFIQAAHGKHQLLKAGFRAQIFLNLPKYPFQEPFQKLHSGIADAFQCRSAFF